MESLNLGLAYTAFSRVCEFSDLALANKIPWQRLECINRHKRMIARNNELHRLQQLEKQTLPLASCSIQQYIEMITVIDTLCDDGITDSRCSLSSDECVCVYHKKT